MFGGTHEGVGASEEGHTGKFTRTENVLSLKLVGNTQIFVLLLFFLSYSNVINIPLIWLILKKSIKIYLMKTRAVSLSWSHWAYMQVGLGKPTAELALSGRVAAEPGSAPRSLRKLQGAAESAHHRPGRGESA